MWVCDRDKWREFIVKKVEEFMAYSGDPIDDWEEFISEYEETENGRLDRIIRVMSPIGQELYFHVGASPTSEKVSIKLLYDSWKKYPSSG